MSLDPQGSWPSIKSAPKSWAELMKDSEQESSSLPHRTGLPIAKPAPKSRAELVTDSEPTNSICYPLAFYLVEKRAPTLTTFVPDGPPDYVNSRRTTSDGSFEGACSSCKRLLVLKRDPLVRNLNHDRSVFNSICRDCFVARTPISKRYKCPLCHVLLGTFQEKDDLCAQCFDRVEPGGKLPSTDTPRFYYCTQCRSRMVPPTADSHPIHARICVVCSTEERERREIAGLSSITAHFCRVCDSWIGPNMASQLRFADTGLCLLCEEMERGSDVEGEDARSEKQSVLCGQSSKPQRGSEGWSCWSL